MSQGTKRRLQAKTLTTIEERYNTKHQGPRNEEEVGGQHTCTRGGRAEILEYGVTMYRNDVL